MTIQRKHKGEKGFTLVELAIVLVIIGLIVGGVLAGQDLIKQAGIRSTITQLEQINTAATTFQSKFNGLPGDLLNTTAISLGTQIQPTIGIQTGDANANGTAGRADGNSLIEPCAASQFNIGLGCETALFWVQLSTAGLVTGVQSPYSSTAAITVGESQYVPSTKLRQSALISVEALTGRNYFMIGAQNNAAAAAGAAGTITPIYTGTTAGLTPLEASGIDSKLDDGAPNTGSVTAVTALTPTTISVDNGVAAAANKCVNSSTTTPTYTATTTQFANNPACFIVARTSF